MNTSCMTPNPMCTMCTSFSRSWHTHSHNGWMTMTASAKHHGTTRLNSHTGWTLITQMSLTSPQLWHSCVFSFMWAVVNRVTRQGGALTPHCNCYLNHIYTNWISKQTQCGLFITQSYVNSAAVIQYIIAVYHWYKSASKLYRADTA